MLRGIRKKKGVSEIVGYVLLVSLAVVMGGVLYAWLSSWIPKDIPDCPEGTSLMVKEQSYDCQTQTLYLTLANNGRFGIGGYFIKATESPSQKVATTDISQLLNDSFGDAFKFPPSSIVMGDANNNTFVPNSEVQNIFNLETIGQIYSIEIIPARWQTEDNRLRFVACGEDSILKQEVNASCT
ncbi:hypothetical protein HYT23_05955 [Candidatus Pacearchaeota archaeon]|nr:hypothetical protein [Candidatus Pacearchaeota archaeon]